MDGNGASSLPSGHINRQKHPMISSFERKEALVFTDNSNTYAEWPNPSKASAPSSSSSSIRGHMRTIHFTPELDVAIPSSFKTTNITDSNDSKNYQYTDEPCPSPPPVPMAHKPMAAIMARLPSDRSSTSSTFPLRAPLIKKSIEKRNLQAATNSTSATTTTTATDDSSTNNNDNKNHNSSDLSQLLNKAEELLLSVKTSIKGSPRSVTSLQNQSNRPVEGHPQPHGGTSASIETTRSNLSDKYSYLLHDFPPLTSAVTPYLNPECNAVQIDWLLRGVDDAYDDEPMIDDEEIESILKIGGEPPSQIQFPSYYAATKQTMDNLLAVKYLTIQLNHILIYSAKFGIRRDCSHILLHLPVGIVHAVNEPSQKMIPLTELEYHETAVEATAADRNKKQHSMMREYFVGGVALDKTCTFKLELTDDIVRNWMDGKKVGCLKIELYSYVISPHNVHRSSFKTEPICFGAVEVPLSGLLSSKLLDAAVTCEIEANIDTQKAVRERLKSLPYGRQLGDALLGKNIGSVSSRLSLHTEEKLHARRPATKEQMLLPTDLRQLAMTYVPTEAPKQIERKKLPVHVGMLFYKIDVANAPTVIPCNSSNACSINLSYKLSQYNQEDITIPFSSISSGNDGSSTSSSSTLMSIGMLSTRIHPVDDIHTWTLPLLEIWISWTDVLSGVCSTFLLGVCTVTNATSDITFDRVVQLPISHVGTKKVVGMLSMSSHLHEDRGKCEVAAIAAMSNYTMLHRLTSLSTTQSNQHLSPPPPTPQRQQQQQQQQHDQMEEYVIVPRSEAEVDMRASWQSTISIDSLSNELTLPAATDISIPSTTIINDNSTSTTDTTSTAAAIATNGSDDEMDYLIVASNDAFDEQQQSSTKELIEYYDFPAMSTTGSAVATHVIDISIHNICELPSQSLGCHVSFSLPDRTGAPVSRTFWWDAEYIHLNGRIQHKVSVDLDASLSHLFNEDIAINITDGAESTVSDTVIAYTSISQKDINEIVSEDGYEIRLELYLNDAAALVLLVSHYIEPMALTQQQKTPHVVQVGDRDSSIGLSVTIQRITHLSDELLQLNTSLHCTVHSKDTLDLFTTDSKPVSSCILINEKQDIYIAGSGVSDLMYDTAVESSDSDRLRNVSIRVSVHMDGSHSALGSAVIDLSTLAIGMPFISGWYHIIDNMDSIIGQVKILVSSIGNLNEIISSWDPASVKLSLDFDAAPGGFQHLKQSLEILEESNKSLLKGDSFNLVATTDDDSYDEMCKLNEDDITDFNDTIVIDDAATGGDTGTDGGGITYSSVTEALGYERVRSSLVVSVNGTNGTLQQPYLSLTSASASPDRSMEEEDEDIYAHNLLMEQQQQELLDCEAAGGEKVSLAYVQSDTSFTINDFNHSNDFDLKDNDTDTYSYNFEMYDDLSSGDDEIPEESFGHADDGSDSDDDDGGDDGERVTLLRSSLGVAEEKVGSSGDDSVLPESDKYVDYDQRSGLGDAESKYSCDDGWLDKQADSEMIDSLPHGTMLDDHSYESTYTSSVASSYAAGDDDVDDGGAGDDNDATNKSYDEYKHDSTDVVSDSNSKLVNSHCEEHSYDAGMCDSKVSNYSITSIITEPYIEGRSNAETELYTVDEPSVGSTSSDSINDNKVVGEDVDVIRAGDVALTIDTCHSSPSVDEDDDTAVLDRTEEVDSPVTSKIRNIVTKELDKALLALPPPIITANITGNSTTAMLAVHNHKEVALCLQTTAPPSKQSVVEAQLPTVASSVQAAPTVNKISRLVQMLAAKQSSKKTNSRAALRQGQQRQFIDDETERLSKIMMGFK